MPSATIVFNGDATGVVTASSQASKSVAAAAASAEAARQKIIASFNGQIEGAKKLGASNQKLETIIRRSADMYGAVTEQNADRYIRSIDRMDERARRFKASLAAIGALPTGPIAAPKENVSFREHLHGLSVGGSMGESIGGVVEVLALTELAAKMKEAVSASLEFGEAIHRASDTTGLAASTLSTLHYAATVTGSDFTTMTTAVAKMDRTIAQATQGNVTAIAFMKSLGLNAKELANSPDGAEIAFRKFAQTLAATENPIRRVELATGLLGRAGAEQIPTIIELGNNWDTFRSKAEAAGMMLDERTAASLAATEDRFKDFSLSIKGAGLAFTEGMTPGINQFLDVMAQGKSSMDTMTEWGRDFAKVIAGVGLVAYSSAAGIQAVFGAAETLIPGLGDVAKKDFASVDVLMKQAHGFHDIVFGQPQTKDDVSDFLDRNNLGGRKKKTTGGFEGVGDITSGAGSAERKAAEARRKQEAKDLKDQEAFHLAWAAEEDRNKAQEVLYWEGATLAAVKGSAAYLNAVKHVNESIIALHREQMNAMRSFSKQYMKDFNETGGRSTGENLQITNAGHEALSFVQSMNSGISATKANSAALAEYSIELGLLTGRLTRMDAAQATARLHALEYVDALKTLKDKADFIAGGSTFVDNPLGQQAATEENRNQIKQLDANRAVQRHRDQQDISTPYSSPVDGVRDALEQFVNDSRDMAKQIFGISNQFLRGFNASAVNGIMGGKTDFGNVAKEAGGNILNMGLGAAEGSLLHSFGIGKTADGTKQNPFYVISADAKQAAGSVMGGVKGLLTGGKSFGGFIGTALKMALPFLAGGGDFSNGAIVGENGPELLTGSGHITSNKMLTAMSNRGGGDIITYSIDARGTDPVQTEMRVRAAIVASHQSAVNQSVKQVTQQSSRRPARR